jgi:hypothetical protein
MDLPILVTIIALIIVILFVIGLDLFLSQNKIKDVDFRAIRASNFSRLKIKPATLKVIGFIVLVILIIGLLLIGGFYFLSQTLNQALSPQSTVSPTIQSTGYPAQLGVNAQGALANTETSTIPESSSMTTFDTISGQYSRTTNTINIPSYYWEMWYTADPMTMGGQGESGTKSYSEVFPSLSIQVMDGDNPNQVVDTVTPPGGLDATLWKRTGIDPLPWVEKFYEGHKDYYFIVNAKNLYSYTIEIRIPKNP